MASKQLTTAEYKTKLQTNHPTVRLAVGIQYKGSKSPVLHHCLECGQDFMSRPENVVRRGHNCDPVDKENQRKLLEKQAQEFMNLVERMQTQEDLKQLEEIQKKSLRQFDIFVLLFVIVLMILTAILTMAGVVHADSIGLPWG